MSWLVVRHVCPYIREPRAAVQLSSPPPTLWRVGAAGVRVPRETPALARSSRLPLQSQACSLRSAPLSFTRAPCRRAAAKAASSRSHHRRSNGLVERTIM
ncbi:hypothetical protein UPYG_G00091910 [Umbra pygmaea]|uniref:Uncharacterized protein n=1 Tax=Umbra pygmaea TaxID=75934 RepID=A0ABD0Y0B2_UMBPY